MFDGKDVGNRMLQVANGWFIADCNGGGNYLVSLANPVAGAITPKTIFANVTVADKIYDGGTAATGTFNGLTGVIAGDAVLVDSSSGTLAFLDRNAGNGKAVTATGATLNGADAGNYTLGAVANGTANIQKAALTLTAATETRDYDSTVASSGVVGIAGLVGGDLATATQTFDSKNAGSRRLQVNSWTIDDGNGGGNYAVTRVNVDGEIRRKTINAALTGSVAKVYDGTTAATILPTNLDGIYAGDAVIVSSSAADYDDRNVGTNRLVTVSGISLSGADAGNYLLNGTSASANVGTITARAVTVTANGSGAKTYDRTTLLDHSQLGTIVLTAADGDGVTQGLLAADGVVIDASGVTGTLVDRNAGTGKATTIGGYALTGNGLGNYVLASATTQGLADVGRAALTLTASTATKTYDGTIASTGLVRATGLIAGDAVSATQAFDNRNAGARLLQVQNDYVITDGNDGGNYAVSLSAAVDGRIDQRTVTTTVSLDDKVYDGTIVATGVYGALSNVVAGDSVAAAGGTLTFQDRNVGSGKLVTVGGTILTGGDAGNYLLSPVAGGTATISRKVLTLAASASSKVYDGTTLSAGVVSGLPYPTNRVVGINVRFAER